jgi:hypothetical protein
MERESYALYGKARWGEEIGSWVLCWNFEDEKFARYFARERKEEILLRKQIYRGNEMTETDIELFSHNSL